MATLPEEIDKTGEMPRELLDKMAKTKYTSVTVPEEYGEQVQITYHMQ